MQSWSCLTTVDAAHPSSRCGQGHAPSVGAREGLLAPEGLLPISGVPKFLHTSPQFLPLCSHICLQISPFQKDILDYRPTGPQYDLTSTNYTYNNLISK